MKGSSSLSYPGVVFIGSTLHLHFRVPSLWQDHTRPQTGTWSNLPAQSIPGFWDSSRDCREGTGEGDEKANQDPELEQLPRDGISWGVPAMSPGFTGADGAAASEGFLLRGCTSRGILPRLGQDSIIINTHSLIINTHSIIINTHSIIKPLRDRNEPPRPQPVPDRFWAKIPKFAPSTAQTGNAPPHPPLAAAPEEQSPWETLPCPNPRIWGCDVSEPRGLQGLERGPCSRARYQPEHQLTLISFQGDGEGAEFLPKPGIRAQNLDTTEWHLQSLGVPSAATSEVTEEKFQQLPNLSLIYPWICSSLRTFPLDTFFN